jgi:uracil-DNA glycosylase family 4
MLEQGGFFSRGQLDAMKGVKQVRDVYGPDCKRCGLFRGAKKSRMDYTGDGKRGVLIILEQPGRVEDETGVQLTGPTGDFFRNKLKYNGLELDRDFWKINSLNCYGENKPTRTQLQCCRPMIDIAIKKLQPHTIWLMGKYAVESTYMGRFSHLEIGRWRGLRFPDRETQSWIVPMYHPSFPYRNEKDQNAMSIFDRDLEEAIRCIDMKFPKFESEEKYVNILTNHNAICNVLDQIIEAEWDFFHDYETNSLKPYWPLSKLLTMSICTNENAAFSFPVGYRSHFSPAQIAQIKRRVRKIMLNPNIKKRAQNLKFENAWTMNYWGVVPQSTDWCTMNTSHVIDGRKYFTGLKFQSYYRWGMADYGKHIEPYKKGHPYNRMEELDLHDLLLYGGMDSLVGERLRKVQVKEIERLGLQEACEFRHKGLLAMGKIQENGIPIDQNYYENQKKRLGKRIERIEEKLIGIANEGGWKKTTGKDIDLESNPDLQKLLFEVFKLKPIKETKTGYAVDEEVMTKLNIPFTRDLLTLRKVRKQRNTYIAQFLRETYNGRMHPFFNLHIPRSYRSSSSEPNFQNIPVRDEEAKRITRDGIIPSKGNQLLETDYGSMEVRIGACHSRDPVLIRYIEDPTTDMHRDQGLELFALTSEQITGEIRFYTKNCFVFPQFYGSYYKLCAAELWENCAELETAEGKRVKDHLIDVGVITESAPYVAFEEHVRDCENKFWEMLGVHSEWQQRKIKEYQEIGYVETHFKFRRGGYLKDNKIKNTPIQADAYLCLEWQLGEVIDIAEEEGWKSKIIGQIHDSIVIDADPHEVEHVLKTIKRVGEVSIRERYDWIIVPLLIEAELAKVDESWYRKEEIDNRGYGIKSGELKTVKEISW